METLGSAIAAVLDGDVKRLATLMAAGPSELQDASANLPQLSVSRCALTRVLTTWRDGHCTADDVQKWASFVRRGYIAGTPNTGTSAVDIDIEYDASDEDLIAEIIGRFDEIGDLIDGHVGDDEQQQMLRALQDRP